LRYWPALARREAECAAFLPRAACRCHAIYLDNLDCLLCKRVLTCRSRLRSARRSPPCPCHVELRLLRSWCFIYVLDVWRPVWPWCIQLFQLMRFAVVRLQPPPPDSGDSLSVEQEAPRCNKSVSLGSVWNWLTEVVHLLGSCHQHCTAMEHRIALVI
jgi:hypothetical protein